MTFLLPLAQGGTKTFQAADLEMVMAHMSAGGTNLMEDNGIGYIVGEPGLLVADTSSPSIRTLLYTYSPQPSVPNYPQ